ncbi:MAG: DUF4893 domain-containing protein [Sphingomonas sp.]|jgi:hypothetical protein|uniref:DUF4893 domain-containing protein n=1 Tax=Sphingomonas sp. TaxID=28214 RepID=UPI00356B2BEC
MRFASTLLALAPLMAVGALLSGCMAGTARPRAAIGKVATAPGWAGSITPGDRTLLEALPATWERARASVPQRLKAKLNAEGPLVQPGAALELPALPPGPYYCRLVRLGGAHGLDTFKPDFCNVDGTTHNLSFTKQSGTILPGGWLFPDTDKRQVFLGTFRPARANSAPPYSVDPKQDVAGVVERVAPFRWRLVLTRAGQGALLDIYELVPVTPQVQGAVPAIPG